MRNASKPIAIVCTHCGSKDVSRDAWGDWDEKAQEWVLLTVFDQAYCHRCDGETSIAEVELKARHAKVS